MLWNLFVIALAAATGFAVVRLGVHAIPPVLMAALCIGMLLTVWRMIYKRP
jgi:hypothetical protein